MYNRELIFYVFVLAFVLLCPNLAFSKRINPESYYQDIWCAKLQGVKEVKIGAVRCDCVTKEYAIEFDFANKYHEAIGQALEYGFLLNKKPAIILIIEYKKDRKYYDRLKKLVKALDLDIKILAITK